MRAVIAAIRGCLTQPYDTMAAAVERRDWLAGALVPATLIPLVALYWIGVPAANVTAWWRVGGVIGWIILFGFTFFAAAWIVAWACRAVGGQAEWREMVAAWGLTYVPTGGWFLMMMLVHFVPGWTPDWVNPFQIAFAVLSLAFFLWKLLLYYFTLRLAGRLTFKQIVLASLILAPIALAYWAGGMYLGLFKVPLI